MERLRMALGLITRVERQADHLAVWIEVAAEGAHREHIIEVELGYAPCLEVGQAVRVGLDRGLGRRRKQR